MAELKLSKRATQIKVNLTKLSDQIEHPVAPYLSKTKEEQPAGEDNEDITDSPGNLDPIDV